MEYSGKMASQEAQLNQLQSQVDSLNETTASAQQQIQTAQDTVASYENLLKAVEAQQQGNTSNATNALTEVNPEVLSVDARGRLRHDLQEHAVVDVPGTLAVGCQCI